MLQEHNFPEEFIRILPSTLAEFRAHGWAAEEGKKVNRYHVGPGNREVVYEWSSEENGLFYRDCYIVQERTFDGREEISFSHEKSPIWRLSYRGMIDEVWAVEDKEHVPVVWDVLKAAIRSELISVEPSFRPRGRPYYTDEDEYEYEVSWGGDAKNFSGGETITYQHRLVYTGHFHGGLIL